MLRRNNTFLFVLFLCLFILPASSYSTQSIYTIQSGSFITLPPAEKEFNRVAQTLDRKDLDFLRIEKIGKYFSVRLGKFDNRVPAEKLLRANRAHIGSAVVMKAYFKNERIVKSYSGDALSVTKSPAPEAIPRDTNLQVDKDVNKAPHREKTGPGRELFESISGKVNKRNYGDALKIIKTNLSKWPDSPELNGWYGAVLLKLNKPSKALTQLKKASALSPDSPDYHNGIGYCLFFLNKFNEAVSEFQKAVKLAPEHVDALTGLGIVYTRIGSKKKAMECYNKLKRLNKDSAEKLLKLIKNIS